MFIHSNNQTFMVQFTHPVSKSHRYSSCSIYLVSDLSPANLEASYPSNFVENFGTKANPDLKSKMLLVQTKIQTHSKDQFCYAKGRYVAMMAAIRSLINPFYNSNVVFRASTTPIFNHSYLNDFFRQSTAKLVKP